MLQHMLQAATGYSNVPGLTKYLFCHLLSVSVVSVSVGAERRLKDFTGGPTESHSNNNTEKPETHLSQERDVKITLASDLNVLSQQAMI